MPYDPNYSYWNRPKVQTPGGAYAGRPENATPEQLNSLRQQYQQWAWGPGYGNVGTLGRAIPPSLQGVMYANPRDPFMQSVGNITPEFANAMNAVLYPGMSFKTGPQSMGQLLTPMQQPQQPQGNDNPYGDYMNKMMDFYNVRPGDRNQNTLMDMMKLMQSGAYQPY